VAFKWLTFPSTRTPASSVSIRWSPFRTVEQSSTR